MGRPRKIKQVAPRVEPAAAASIAIPPFAEAAAWQSIGAGWRPLFGSYRQLGFSFEWHEFTAVRDFDWARSFHPGSVELCVNLEGRARLSTATETVEFSPKSFGFYFQGEPALTATRLAGDKHRFLTVEYAPEFLREHFGRHVGDLHPLVAAVVQGEAQGSTITSAEYLASSLERLIESLRLCPVFAPAQEVWFRSKALELASHLFFRAAGNDLFCSRTLRLARDRVEKAQAILRERLQSPPPLEELSRMVNCSPFYLSRLFSQEAGMTMQQYLRRIRIERAAELLRSGRCNVTEAALEVGYSSLSHFSSTFHEIFGCCPALYPLKTSAQQTTAPV